MIYFIIPTVLTKSTTFRLSTNFATVFFVSLLHSGNRNCAAYLCRKPSIIPNSAPIIVLMHCTFAARVVLSLHCYSLWLFRYIFFHQQWICRGHPNACARRECVSTANWARQCGDNKARAKCDAVVAILEMFAKPWWRCYSASKHRESPLIAYRWIYRSRQLWI